MNAELLEAMAILEKEKNISREVLIEAIQQSLMQAYRNQYEKSDNVTVTVDPETAEYHIIASKEVVEEVEDPTAQMTLADAQKINPAYQIGDVAQWEIESKNFGRIATQNAKNVILQKIREEERKSIYNQYIEKEHDIVTGVVQRYIGRNISINLGRTDGWLSESEQVRGENLRPTQRVKVYVLEVKDLPKGPRILVSRTHPELVRRLFEEEVTEIRDGVIEIKAIAREAGSRTKVAVASNDPDVDPVGACVGLNGSRVNMIVDELHGEKIDIVNWDENEAYLIENALSPAKVISVLADPDERTALVIVPDYQLSLAIGKEGQNARLAAHLTQYKIDIKSESQAKEEGLFDEYYEGEEEYEDYEEYDEESMAASILEEAVEEAEAASAAEEVDEGEVAAEAVEEAVAAAEEAEAAAENGENA